MKELYNLRTNLLRLRTENKYTQTTIANYLGITYQSYQAYERGLTVPSLKNFIKLAKLYDISLDDLIE